jgi:hypothetical protein
MPLGDDDGATIAAIAILAGCVAAAAHEAMGHGGACLLLGGAITRLTSVYFQCTAHGTWIAAAGPIGNLVAGALAWIANMLLPDRAIRARLLMILTMAFSIFWFAGYLIYSAALNDGDLYFVARDLVGQPGLGLRAAAIAMGVAAYWVGIRALRTSARSLSSDAWLVRKRLMQSWLAASVSACIAALAYAPDRLGAMQQAALEIGATSLPMLARLPIGVTGAALDGQITRSWPWICASIVVFALFVATLGRGLP